VNLTSTLSVVFSCPRASERSTVGTVNPPVRVACRVPQSTRRPHSKLDIMAAAATRSLHSFLALLLLLPAAAAAAALSYETKSIDPGLVVMTLPEPVSGPESLAFDGRGGGPYSGVSDGRILRWQGPLRGWTEFAYNSKHR
jgi:hypothetical protein